MKVWDVMISGHKGTKYHRGILIEDFEEIINRLHKGIAKATLEKNRGRSMYFLSLTHPEVSNVIDEIVIDALCTKDEEVKG